MLNYLLLLSSVFNFCGFLISLIYYIYIKSNDLIAFSFGKAETGNTYLGLFITFIILTAISVVLLILNK